MTATHKTIEKRTGPSPPCPPALSLFRSALSSPLAIALLLVLLPSLILLGALVSAAQQPLVDGGTYHVGDTVLVPIPPGFSATDTLLLTTPTTVYRYHPAAASPAAAARSTAFSLTQPGRHTLTLAHQDGTTQDLASFDVLNASVEASLSGNASLSSTLPFSGNASSVARGGVQFRLSATKVSYAPSETVSISIQPLVADRAGLSMTITHGDTMLTSQGSLGSEVDYTPAEPGTYVFTLLDDGREVDSITVGVTSPPSLPSPSSPSSSSPRSSSPSQSPPPSSPPSPSPSSPSSSSVPPSSSSSPSSYLRASDLSSLPAISTGELPQSLLPARRIFPGVQRQLQPGAVAPTPAAEKESKDAAKARFRASFSSTALAGSFSSDERVRVEFHSSGAIATKLGAALSAGYVSQSLASPLLSLGAGQPAVPAKQAITILPATNDAGTTPAAGTTPGEGTISGAATATATLSSLNLSVDVQDYQGLKVETPFTIEKENATAFAVTLDPTRALRPGFYAVTITDLSTGAQQEEWFAYGLISVNTEHPIYHPGERARLLLVVLNSAGVPIAGAPIALAVTSPSGGTETFSTAAGTVQPTLERGVYQAYYDIGGGLAGGADSTEGNYTVAASTTLDGKPVAVATTFAVLASFPYDIARAVPSTVDPAEGPFTNEFSILPLTTGTGNGSVPSPDHYTLIEYLPSSFIITNTSADDIRVMNDTYVLTWYNASSDERLYYEAQPPLLSPYLYSLGQAEIRYVDPSTGAPSTFEEARPWLFAIDPAALTCSASPCDTGTSVNGRDTITGGAEPNQPNTIDTCTDGTSGTYHSDESLDRIVIGDLNSTTFTAGDTVQVNITVWCYGTTDNLNWVYTNNSVTPSWRAIASINCPSGGSLQTFSQTFALDDAPGNQTIRGVFQYQGSGTATCGGGAYDDNDDVTLSVQARDSQPPQNLALGVNQTTVPINGSVKVLAQVTDNVAVAGVNATVKEPDGTSTNLTLAPTNVTSSSLTGDLEPGTIAYAAITTPPGNATVQQGLVTFSSAQASQTIPISQIDPSHAFIIVASTADAQSNADRFTYIGSFLNSTAITLTRSATGTAGSASYYVVTASDINVTNGTTPFATTSSTIDVPIPDQGSGYATKTLVVLNVESQSSSRSYVSQAYVTGELTNQTNLRLTRDASGNAALVVQWFVIRFLDATTVQTGQTTVTTTGTAALSSVATNRTWLYFTTRMSANGLAYTSIRGNLASSTQASFSRVSSSGTAETRWFAVQFPDSQGAWAQQGLQSGTTTEATANIPITSVNTSRSFGYVTQDSTGTGTAYPRPWWTEQLASATSIQVARGYTGTASNHDWQAVSWPVDPGTRDTETNKSFTTYNDVSSADYASLAGITVAATVSAYSNAGSQQRGNNAANLEAQLYDGSAWVSLGLFNVTAAGTYTITTTDPTLLSAWLTAANRDVRVRAVSMDYADASHIDSVSYAALNVTLDGNQTRYAADWNSTQQAGLYNITDLWSYDTAANVNHTAYSGVTFLALNYGTPAITIDNVENDTTETYAFFNRTPTVNATIDTNATCYLSAVDESYSQMAANGRVSCGGYALNVPKACVYSQTLPIGSTVLHMACNNSFSGVANNATDNKDFNVDVLCSSHADCAANQYCDYTFHCAADIPDGYECKQATYNDQPSDAACGGGSDPGTCVNDSSYFFTGWYCAKNSTNCVFNDSGHTYDQGYALCNALAGPNDYRSCAAGQAWSPVVDCGDLNQGADQNATAAAHPGGNCSYYAAAQACVSGPLSTAGDGCVGAATGCSPYVYLGSGLCGNVLADCDAGCGAQCDADTNLSAAIVNGTCHYDKSCSDACILGDSTALAPLFCIDDSDGGTCAYANRTDPSAADTCYYDPSCADTAGVTQTQNSTLRQDYCDYCTATGTVQGDYAPAPNASCSSNCSDNGTIWYDSGGTPLSRADDCNATGGTTILNDTLAPGDVWNGSGAATCDDAECALDAGPYLDGSCVGGPTGTCVFTDPDPPALTIVSPSNGAWFSSSPAVFQYQVLDLGSGTANCSLLVDGAIVNTTTNPAESATINLTYAPSLGNFTWSIQCYDKSAQQNKASSGNFTSGYDNTPPSLSNPARNGTVFDINQYVCLNVTATDTYSGVTQVLAEIDLPSPYTYTNLTLSNSPTICNPSGNPNIYSTEYRLVYSGPFNWTTAYAADVAGNLNSLAVGLGWSVNAAGFLAATLLSPGQDVTINESGANDNLTLVCSVRCTEQGIGCVNVSLSAQYDPGKGSGLWTMVNTTSANLTSNASSHFCGDLNTSQPQWWNASFSYREAVIVTDTTGADTTNLSVRLVLNATNFDFAHANSDGSDLRVTWIDPTRQQLPAGFWIESWNATAQTAVVWAMVPEMAASNNATLYLYYGNATATSASDGQEAFLAFDTFATSGLGTYWQTVDADAVTGTAFSVNSGTLNVTAGGTDTWTTTDQYGSVFRSISGDFNATVQVIGQQNSNAWAKAGIMVRNNMSAAGNSTGYAFAAVTPGNGYAWQTDSNADGFLDANTNGGTPSVYPTYIRVIKSGTTFSMYYSKDDGATWPQMGTATALSSADAAQDIGMSVTSHAGATLSSVIFDNLRVQRYVSSAPAVTFQNETDASAIAAEAGTYCNASFLVSSAGDLSGNNTWPLRCEAYASNAPTTYSSSLNVSVNDHPDATITFPVNDTWVTGTILVNASASSDSDGTIANYLFEYGNTTAFSSPTAICNGAASTCSWNTLLQDQCLNNTKGCYLRVVATDNLGLSSASAPLLLGFDTLGPATTLDLVRSDGNVSTNTTTLNATVTDGGVGTISRVLFEYRANSTAIWQSACNDTDGTAPFSCMWNTTALPDGPDYQVRAYANDTLGNNGSADVHTNITLDRTPPDVTLLGPPNATYDLGNETFLYNVTDLLSPVADCSLWLDGQRNRTTPSPTQNATLNFTVTGMAEGGHTWQVRCTDSLGNAGASSSRTVTVDLTGPSVTLVLPANGGSAYGLSAVNATATDSGVGNISQATFLYRENSTAIWQSACNDTDGTAPFSCMWNTTALPDGPDYQVRAYANDTLGNTGAADTHVSITVDNNPPAIDGLSPSSGSKDLDGNITFRYRVDDAGSAVANCSLYINGTLNQTTASPTEGSYLYFYLYNLNDTTFNWSIGCWDAFAPQPHFAMTANRTLIVQIMYILQANLTTDKTVYQQGDQAGETANITVNTTDAVNASLDASAITDLILTAGDSRDVWWNTTWKYRVRTTLTEDQGIDRTGQWVSLPFTLDAGCDGLASTNSLRLVQDAGTALPFDEWNVTMCPDGIHIQSLWVSFRLDLAANQSADIYLYFDNGTGYTPTGTLRGPMRFVWVSTGGSGNAPNSATIKSDLAAALSNLGLSSTGFYDELSTSAASSDFTLNDLQNYSIVMYDSAAKYQTSIYAAEATALHSYVNQSGDLFITGQDLGYDANRLGFIFGSDWQNITRTAAGWVDNAAPASATIDLNHPVTQYAGPAGTVFTIAGDYPDGFTTLSGGPSRLIINWTGNANPIAGTASDGLFDPSCAGFCGKTAYYAGVFYVSTSQGIQSATVRQALLEGMIDWFLNNRSLSLSTGQLERWVARNTTASTGGSWTWPWNVYGRQDGRYEAVTQASRTKYNNATSWTAFNITNDTTPPVVTLVSPANGSEQNSSVTFSYSVDDALSTVANCSLSIDGSVSDTDLTIQETLPQFFYPRLPSGGPHTWNVCCADPYGNTGCAANRTVIIIPPDLASSAGNITVSPAGPYEEDEQVAINATVWNIGGSDTPTNFTVQLWDGDPSSGTQIGGDYSINLTDRFGSHSNQTLTWNWTIPRPGTSTLHLILDPPLATNGTISELNESNNDIAFNVTTPAYTVIYGSVRSTLLLSSSQNQTFINRSSQANNTGLIFFTDGQDVDFGSLQALGRTVTNTSATMDFTDADTLLNMTGFNDSVDNVWARGNNTPLALANYTVQGKPIDDVPVVNSSANGVFRTGILWDTSKDTGDGQYDTSDKEPLVFFTAINSSEAGDYGVYDYQSKVPALLRDYAGTGTGTIAIYYELT